MGFEEEKMKRRLDLIIGRLLCLLGRHRPQLFLWDVVNYDAYGREIFWKYPDNGYTHGLGEVVCCRCHRPLGKAKW